MEEIIFKYFPHISDKQKEQFKALYPLYKDWNEKINVISRKDIDNLYIHHVLHSMAIAKYIQFPKGSRVLDVGTGGGFPGIPLAILYPECSFYLCDSIKKKITVVSEISQSLNLKNITANQIRAEEINQKFDFVVSRAVTELSQFVKWVWQKIDLGKIEQHNRGIIYLKGGDLNQEFSNTVMNNKIEMKQISKIEISQWFQEEWFIDKSVIFINRNK